MKLNVPTPPHMMLPVITASSTETSAATAEPIEGLSHRVLPRPSWSTLATLVLLCRLSSPTRAKATAAKRRKVICQTDKWDALLGALLRSFFEESFSIHIYDCALEDFSPGVPSSGQLLCVFHGAKGYVNIDSAADCPILKDYFEETFECNYDGEVLLLHVARHIYAAPRHGAWVFVQIANAFSMHIEKQILGRFDNEKKVIGKGVRMKTVGATALNSFNAMLMKRFKYYLAHRREFQP